jgi:hypothetical protein
MDSVDGTLCYLPNLTYRTPPNPPQKTEARETGELLLIDRMEAALTALDGPLSLAVTSPFRAFVEERGWGGGGVEGGPAGGEQEPPKKVKGGFGWSCGPQIPVRRDGHVQALVVNVFVCLKIPHAKHMNKPTQEEFQQWLGKAEAELGLLAKAQVSD